MSINVPVCPSDEILDWLKANYKYDPDSGVLYRYLKSRYECRPVGYYDAKGYLA